MFAATKSTVLALLVSLFAGSVAHAGPAAEKPPLLATTHAAIASMEIVMGRGEQVETFDSTEVLEVITPWGASHCEREIAASQTPMQVRETVCEVIVDGHSYLSTVFFSDAAGYVHR